MHAIDEALRDKILNPLAAFCFKLKLSGANDEGFCVLYYNFIRCDLGGYPLSSRTFCSFELVFSRVDRLRECRSATEWFKKAPVKKFYLRLPSKRGKARREYVKLLCLRKQERKLGVRQVGSNTQGRI